MLHRAHLDIALTPASFLAAFAALVTLSVGAPAFAQPSFNSLANSATEVSGHLTELVAPLFEECTGRSRARCLRQQRQRHQRMRNENYLWGQGAVGHIRIDPYEPMGGGFRVAVTGFAARDAGTLVATRPLEDGALPPHVLGEGFVPVPEAAAQRWLVQNSVDRLRLRVVFRVGARFRDGDSEGIKLDVIAVQVFNSGTGSVLVDTTRARELPTAPYPLERRLRLWDNNGQAEALWVSPAGVRVVFGVRVDPVVDPPNSSAPVVQARLGAHAQSLVRFVGTCCSANVSIVPRNPAEVLIIITERAQVDEQPGAGQVLLARWLAAQNRFSIVARWRGSNHERPPAWVVDNDAPIPAMRASDRPGEDGRAAGDTPSR